MLEDRGVVRAGRLLVVGLLVVLVSLTSAATVAGAAGLPDGRRYELVTPTKKNGADVLPNPQRTRASAAGNAIQYSSLTGFGDVHGAFYASDYIAVRDPAGVWHTHGITPIQEPGSFPVDVGAGFEARYMGEFSSDLSHGVFMAKTPLTDAPNVDHSVNLYLRSDLLNAGLGAYQLLTDAESDQGDAYDPTINVRPEMAGASTDFSHVIFESRSSLLTETALLDPALPKLYEWVDGTTRFVGMIPTALATTCGAGGPACVPAPSQAGRGALAKAYPAGVISHDGRRIIFTVPDTNGMGQITDGQLYLRDDQGTPTLSDDVTLQVNASERTTHDPQQIATFWAASADGTKIFFTTSEKLTNEDPNDSSDLYRYDENALPGQHLTRISIDDEPGDNQGNDLAAGHNVAGAIGASDDGNTVYFIVNGSGGTQLINGANTTNPIGNNGAFGDARIYRWQNGTLHEVAGINDGVEVVRLLGAVGWGFAPKLSRLTPDGRHLAFLTQGTDQLLSHYAKPEYDHGTCAPFGDTGGCLEVYVYDAAANNGSGDLQCASCNPTGTHGQTNATFMLSFALSASLDTVHLNHPLSDDGHYVFFDTADQLVPDDKNTTTDAYEYNTQTHQVHLLSSGTGTSHQIFLDASADGTNAFILTRTPLRTEDHDQDSDIYNARINGTPDPGPTTPHICDGENCRAPATPTATPQHPASRRFQGPHDRLAPPNPAAFFFAQPLRARQRHQLTHRGRTRITISTSQPGTLTIRVKIRTGRHTHTIQTLRRTLEHAATIHPTIRLGGAARRHLNTHHRLRLIIQSSYSQTPVPQTIRATLIS